MLIIKSFNFKLTVLVLPNYLVYLVSISKNKYGFAVYFCKDSYSPESQYLMNY